MFWKRYLLVAIISIWLFLFLNSPAYAYLDPGSGSYACQLLLAGLLAVMYLVRLYWRKIRAFILGFLSRDVDGKDV